jgi:cardiolipin synthase
VSIQPWEMDFEMKQLLDAVSAIVHQVSPEKAKSIASKIRQITPDIAQAALVGVVGTPAASLLIDDLVGAWRVTNVSAIELAAMLLASSHVLRKTAATQSIELVWTGPTTPFVSARRTEQALLQVINDANSELFITSFVAYDFSSIVKALNQACTRGVVITMLLESSQEHGGSINVDVIGRMRTLVPAALLYAWRDKDDEFYEGRVHAKVAVADGTACFITSANLTGYAMERNMEAGVLITGGQIPKMLNDHLRSLVETRVVRQV